MVGAVRYACSGCESRQSTDTACTSCGHPVVLDLDDPASIERLRDEQRRRRDALLNRCRGLGVIAAIPVAGLAYWIIDQADILARPGFGAGAAFVAIAGLFITGLERTYGARRFFRYLDEPRR
jgi:hypothetical protein